MTEIFSKTAFSKKNIIISGGAGDIGMAIAEAFAKSGATKIALLDRDEAGLKKSQETLSELGTQPIAIPVNLAEEREIHQAIKRLYEASNKWDVLVTTAGHYIGETLVEFKMDDWDRLMNINARSVFLLSQLVGKHMVEEKQGKIIHIGSSSTFFGTPGSGGYAASKAIVNQLTKTMAVEWGLYNIQVNAVCPTVTETKFLKLVAGDERHAKLREKLKSRIPLGRLLIPEDIAPSVLFLASEGSQFINGVVFLIDGGARWVST